MNYTFDIEIAKEYGVNEAILITNLQFWIKKNQANDKNYYDGHYWTYNSIKAWQQLFPFWTEKTIRTILNHLIDKGVIITSNYNQSKYDRTLWYAFADESRWLYGKIHLPKRENGIAEKGEPIPDNKPDNKPDSIYTHAKQNQLENQDENQLENQDDGQVVDKDIDKDIYINNIFNNNIYKQGNKRFTKPTLEQVKQYCIERNNNVDCDRFVNYYESNGWKVGKSPMKDWKAAVRNWERSSYSKKETTFFDEQPF